MKVLSKIDGGEIISTREYDVAYNGDIKEGAIVKVAAGKAVKAAQGETGAILGVAAETHKGVEDALNVRADGTKLMVCDADVVMACDAPIVAATGGSATTVTASTLGAYANDDWNGGYLVLVEKADGSTNTDKIGTVKEITDYAYASSGTVSTFTVATGGTANDGAKYALFPPTGLAKGYLSSDATAWGVTGVTCTSLKVVGRDIEAGLVTFKAASKF